MDGAEPTGLAALERRVGHDLACLNHPPANWVPPRRTPAGAPMVDVAIVGAGMCGLAAAFALQREGIAGIRQLDAAAAGREGPWVTYARMRTLRSPKHLVGPAMGIPSLTFRAWFEAQWGAAAWAASGRIPRAQWMDYLVWFRRVLGLRVENGVAVTALKPDAGYWWVETDRAGRFPARKVVLANGRDGLGGNRVPAVVRGLPAEAVSHTRDDIDFAALAGRRVAVLGGGASACDNAAEALEAGAAEVHQFVRRPDWPRINKFKGIVYAGFVHGFPLLPPADRWRILTYAFGVGVPPPRESLQRLAGAPAYRLHLGSPWRQARWRDGAVEIATPKETVVVDQVILGTGFVCDIARRPELAAVAGEVALWRDRFAPPPGETDDDLLRHPWLGPAFELTERTPGRQPMLRHLHVFNQAAALSHGLVAGDIPSVADGAQRLARGIARHFFLEDEPALFQALRAFDEPELLGDELD